MALGRYKGPQSVQGPSVSTMAFRRYNDRTVDTMTLHQYKDPLPVGTMALGQYNGLPSVHQPSVGAQGPSVGTIALRPYDGPKDTVAVAKTSDS